MRNGPERIVESPSATLTAIHGLSETPAKMTARDQYPAFLWNNERIPRSVASYLAAHRGEFDTDMIVSGYPYAGPASRACTGLTPAKVGKIRQNWGYHCFAQVGGGCWQLRSVSILNALTADFLAAAELLGGIPMQRMNGGSPGGLTLERGNVWVPLLDGGVGVEVHLWEHERTNMMHGRQRTTIRGAKAFRACLELLGFDPPLRRLTEELRVPPQTEVRALVLECLARKVESG